MATDRGLAGLAFADPAANGRRWPHAVALAASALCRRARRHRALCRSHLRSGDLAPEQPLRVVMIGSDFELRVWETLLKLPLGKATTYSEIAAHIGRPSAARAVGTAVGKNPISFVVPCHRVLGKSGGLCGYHWGLTRKRAILGWEAGMLTR